MPEFTNQPLLPEGLFLQPDSSTPSVPIWLIGERDSLETIPDLTPAQRAWLKATGFNGSAKKQTLLPDVEGRLSGVAFGTGNGAGGDPSGPSTLLLGQLAASLPPGSY